MHSNPVGKHTKKRKELKCFVLLTSSCLGQREQIISVTDEGIRKEGEKKDCRVRTIAPKAAVFEAEVRDECYEG